MSVDFLHLSPVSWLCINMYISIFFIKALKMADYKNLMEALGFQIIFCLLNQQLTKSVPPEFFIYKHIADIWCIGYIVDAVAF